MLVDSREPFAIPSDGSLDQGLRLRNRDCFLRQGTAAEDFASVSLRTRPPGERVLRGAVVDEATGIGDG